MPNRQKRNAESESESESKNEGAITPAPTPLIITVLDASSSMLGRVAWQCPAGTPGYVDRDAAAALIQEFNSFGDVNEYAKPKFFPQYGTVLDSYNAFIDEQRKLSGLTDIALVTFGQPTAVVMPPTPIYDVPKLDENTYKPVGGSPLWDGMRLAMATGQNAETATGVKPLVVLITDGHPDDHSSLGCAQVEGLTKRGWTFIYLGLGNRVSPSSKFGIPVENSLIAQQGQAGVVDAVRAMSRAAIAYRNGQSDFATALKSAQEEGK